MQLERTGLVSIIILAVIVSSVGGAYVYFNYFYTPEKIVEVGDCVLVNYIAKYANNGTVFATSYEDVAKENGIYNENASYEPLKIFVDPDGSREIPKGFENFSSFPPLGMKKGFIKYLVGMKEGESKTVVLSPDEAYGTWNISLAKNLGFYEMKREATINCTEKINRTQFSHILPNLTIEKNVTFDGGYIVFGVKGIMNGTIIDVDSKNVTIKLFPRNGTTFTLPVLNFTGEILYTNGSSNFTLHISTKVNKTFTVFWLFTTIHCKVISVNETTINMAINMYAPSISLIDQPIEVFLHVEKIYKTSKTD